MSLDELCRGELSGLILRRVVWQFKMSFPKKVNNTCHFCAINVSSGEGTVPLFKPTKNNEFCGKSFCKTGTIILSDLIKSVGIDIDCTSESDSSLCKKCARKIVNCCTMFHELEERFMSKIISASETNDDECSGGGNKRLHSQNYSPSGLTPGSKKQKGSSYWRAEGGSRSRKTLFQLNSAWSAQEKLDDSVVNLTCLPVTETNVKDDYSSAVVKVADAEITPNEPNSEEAPCVDDSILNYHNSRLQIGLLLMNIADGMKDGDGYRLVNCYKFVLLFAYQFHNTKYAYALLLFFIQIYAVLSEEEAFCLIFNRFINSKGKCGGNIPLHLFMEHLNLLLKRLAKGMGANVTSASLQRAAQSIVPLNKVMETIYKDCNKVKRSGHHGSTDPEEAVSIIVKDLISGKVFETSPGRKGYPSFQKFQSNVLDIDYRDLFQWAKDRFHDWKAIYEVTKH